MSHLNEQNSEFRGTFSTNSALCSFLEKIHDFLHAKRWAVIFYFWKAGFTSNHICSLRTSASFWLILLKEAINLNCKLHLPSFFNDSCLLLLLFCLSGYLSFRGCIISCFSISPQSTYVVSNHKCNSNWKRNLESVYSGDMSPKSCRTGNQMDSIIALILTQHNESFQTHGGELL